jgi:hypothetical protein
MYLELRQILIITMVALGLGLLLLTHFTPNLILPQGTLDYQEGLLAVAQFYGPFLSVMILFTAFQRLTSQKLPP